MSMLLMSVASHAFAEFEAKPLHLPNFVGRNVCFGVQGAPTRPDWSAPFIETRRKLDTEEATHDIVFDDYDRIHIEEMLVDQTRCQGEPLGSAVWNQAGTAEFCLASWDKGKFVRITLQATYRSASYQKSVQAGIYAVGVCKLGDHPDTPEYGDVLKMDNGIPVLNPDYTKAH